MLSSAEEPHLEQVVLGSNSEVEEEEDDEEEDEEEEEVEDLDEDYEAQQSLKSGSA
jgi:hypothetical protein